MSLLYDVSATILINEQIISSSIEIMISLSRELKVFSEKLAYYTSVRPFGTGGLPGLYSDTLLMIFEIQ